MADKKVPLPWDDYQVVKSEPLDNQPKPDGPVFDLHEDVAGHQVENDDSSKQMWHAMEEWHNKGFSMMWGRAEDDPVRKKKAKSPLVSTWSSEVESRLSLQELSRMMMRANTKIKIAPIIICGKGSGNLIVVDIDVKWWPGIDTIFLTAFRETFPTLYAKITRHRTPSGGVHLLYRTEEYVHFPSKNPKLATLEGAGGAGIESRTHGGYVMAPPGMGYSVEYDVPIPTISVEDHQRIFDLARALDQEKKVKAAPKQKAVESVYDENPFVHYNSSPEAERVLLDYGWKFDYSNSYWEHYTRPGKDGGVSASFHKEKRFYHFFTTSTEVDTSKWNGNYDPANVLNMIGFHGDWKKTFLHLKNSGFGKYKSSYEAKIIKAATATGKPLPANFSEEAKQQLETAISTKNEKYPHGIFWEYLPESDNYLIHRELLDRFLNNLQVYVHKGEPCIIDGPFIRKLKEDKKQNGVRDVYRLIKSWIREEEEEVYNKISHEFTKFWQSSGDFTISTLPELDKNIILKSNVSVSYKAFLNGILVITKDGKEVRGFDTVHPFKVWADDVIQREFHYVDYQEQQKSMYVDFINKAINGAAEYKQACVGYLCCGHKRKSGSYFLSLMEPGDASMGGGTGKNFFCDILGHWTTVLTTNGQSVKKDVDQLIQNWNGEKIVHLSDLPKWVNLTNLKSIVTDDSQRKVLYKDIQNVASEDMPKFVLSGQFGLDTKGDGGVRRRVRQLSFSGYFHGDGAISGEYGGDCPDIWDSKERCKAQGWAEGEGNDWNGYYSYIADGIQLYLKTGKVEMVEDFGLWLKGFDTRYSNGYSYFRDGIEEKIEQWAQLAYVTKTQVMDWYNKVCVENGISQNNRLRVIKQIHEGLREYGLMMDLYDYQMGQRREYVDGERQWVVTVKMFNSDDNGEKKDEEEILPF